jgi:uncharacterized protein (DUF1778 family)
LTISLQCSSIVNMDTPKKVMINMRIPPSQKDFIREACDLTNKTMTQFLLDSSIKRAEKTLGQKYVSWVKSYAKNR